MTTGNGLVAAGMHARVGTASPLQEVPGTLIWVGDRNLDEFFEAFRFCENRVAQIAVRRDLWDAVRRPASSVRRVIVTRDSRRPLDDDAFRELRRAYPSACFLELMGPLCADGIAKAVPGQPFRIHWHQANQVLPRWLPAAAGDGEARWAGRGPGDVRPDRGGSRRDDGGSVATSVAVVSAVAANAEPLMDLAASVGKVAIWCRQPDSFRLRNVDVVWWDDSATGRMGGDEWHRRMGAMRSGNRSGTQRHAWLVTAPHIEHCRTAYDAGVELILTKPARVEPLLEMLTSRTSRWRLAAPMEAAA